MRLSRDSWLAIGLVLALAAIIAVTAIQQARPSYPALSSHSSAPMGARALRLWLEALQYPVLNEAQAAFGPPAESGLALILEPSANLMAEERALLDAWVEAGGMLVLAGSGPQAAAAVRHYDFAMRPLGRVQLAEVVQVPLLQSPPPGRVEVLTQGYLQSERDDFITHLAVAEGPVLVSFEQGAGRVFLAATPVPFANAGLKLADNPALVLSIVGAAGRAGSIWFDEWHHGLRQVKPEISGPGEWLRSTPMGWALLFVAAVTFLSLWLRGRSFGRPVPATGTNARRAPVEYVTAIANLSRRAGRRRGVMQQYHRWLKRDLGRRYRLSPALPDDQYVAHLARFDASLDGEALLDLLTALDRGDADEREMVRLVAEAAERLNRKGGDVKRVA